MQTNPSSQTTLRCGLLLLALLLSPLTAIAQTTTFTYQGKLVDAGAPANGSYDFQFKMFDALTSGSAVASASVNGVTVTNGVFTVNLDFGVCPSCFNGGNRFLAISVKATSGSTFTDLNPRQQITSAPYAIKSQSATSADGLSVACANCVTSGQIGSVSGSVVTGVIPVSAVPPGSGNYIQNAVSLQASSNFNISGNGTVAGTLSGSVLNANTQYNLGGSRVLSNAGLSNLFVGMNAGAANTSGGANSFFGFDAGQSNVSGGQNSFFGDHAGASNLNGGNSFFGAQAGQNNTTGSGNSFFGNDAGDFNISGGSNSFFGILAGASNDMGSENSFFGASTGFHNTGGSLNSFFGSSAGFNNTTGKRNVMLGYSADFRNSQATSSGNLAGDANLFLGFQAGGAPARRNAVAIGANAFVACDDCMVLGGFTGVKVGIGMTTPQQNLSVNGGLVIDQAALNDGTLPAGANAALTFGSGSGEGIASKRTASGNQFGLDFYTNFINRMSITQNGDVRINHKLVVNELGAPPSANLCINLSNELSNCSSSLRYKTNVLSLNSGLELVHRLRPVTFDWKTTGQRDLGLIAEEVEKVEPLLVTWNKTGQIEGVKYDRISAVLVNAIKEQQSQITTQQTRMETQQSQIDTQLLEIQKQQTQIDSLLKIVCLEHPGADICKPRSN